MDAKTVRLVCCFLFVMILATGGALIPARAQDDAPEYRFLLRVPDDALFRVDCSDGQCTTVAIPLPLTEDCPAYRVIVPMPGNESIMLVQRCYGTAPSPKRYLIDLEGNVLAEYNPRGDYVWLEAFSYAGWSPDDAFLVLGQATGPSSFALVFYDPDVGFYESVSVGGSFGGFSPDGTRMLFMLPSERFPLSGEPAIADVAQVVADHEIHATYLLNEDDYFVTRGWLSDHSVRLQVERDDGVDDYALDLDTGELALYDPAEDSAPYPYRGGIQVRRSGGVFEVWDTNTDTLIDTMTFALPDDYFIEGFSLETCERCAHYWLNAPEE